MLKKLYKHEFYSLFRSMLGIYAGLLGLAVVSKISFLLSEETMLGSLLQGATLTMFVLGAVAMFVIGFCIVIVRFYKNLLSKEGYLTFTLPFKAESHITCKLVCGCTVIVANVIALIIALVIFFIGTDSMSTLIENIKFGIEMLFSVYETWQIAVVAVEVVLLLLISLVNLLLMPYAAMAIGQRFRNKIGGSVIGYLILYGAHETVDMIIIIIGSFFENQLTTLATENGFALVSTAIGAYIIYESIASVIYCLITRNMLKKHLNLE